MSDKVKFNQKSFGQGLIITGLAELVENEGLTPHEAFEVLRDIQRYTWSALCEIKRESEAKCQNHKQVEGNLLLMQKKKK